MSHILPEGTAMAVILKDGSVFLHIPKTGGTWVASVLRDLDLARCSIGHRHANWPHLLAPGNQGIGRKCEYLYKRARFLKVQSRPFTFCFVRHPLAWYESFYRYKSRPDVNWKKDGEPDNFNRWHPNAVLNGLNSGTDGRVRDFNEYVAAIYEKYPGYVSALYSHYTFHSIDFVGKQEALREDLIRVLDRLGFDFDTSKIQSKAPVNVSVGEKVEVKWDRDLREKVLKSEAAALARFGYE